MNDTPQPEFTADERAAMFDACHNQNMMRLAFFHQDSRRAVIELAQIVAESGDLIDTQTVVDTIAAVLDDLTHQYHAALRKRDGLRIMEAK